MREPGKCYSRFKGQIKGTKIYMEKRLVEMNLQMDMNLTGFFHSQREGIVEPPLGQNVFAYPLLIIFLYYYRLSVIYRPVK